MASALDLVCNGSQSVSKEGEQGDETGDRTGNVVSGVLDGLHYG